MVYEITERERNFDVQIPRKNESKNEGKNPREALI